MGIHRRGFLEAAAGAAMLAATGGVGVAGPARAEAPTAAQRRTLLTGSNAAGDHPPGWSPRDSSGAIIDLAATKIALVEPHLDQ